jgi:hypothetical protein
LPILSGTDPHAVSNDLEAKVSCARGAVLQELSGINLNFSSEPARLVREGTPEANEIEEKLQNVGLWSVPPTMMTMFLDNPEVRERVEIH